MKIFLISLIAVLSLILIVILCLNQSSKLSTAESRAIALNPMDIVLPENFFFGTASSDFQSTGGNGKSDWDEHLKKLPPPLRGPWPNNDFLSRYRDDFRLAAQIGIQMHRLSLEWARIEPEEGQWDMEAMKKYKEIFLFMKSLEIEPMICLNHFTIPKWFALKNGWENKDASFYYSRYAEFVARTIGIPLKIKWWLTFNEPQFILTCSYLKGEWPPYHKIKGLDDVEGLTNFIWVYGNLIDAHRLAYRKIHQTMKLARIKPMVGFSSGSQHFEPYDPKSKNDIIVYNFSNMLQTLSFNALAGTDQDFIGIDYYRGYVLKANVHPTKLITHPSQIFSMRWTENDSPSCLYNLILKFSHLGLPIIITENGLNDLTDKQRAQFILGHLQVVSQAIKDGINVIGYIHWTLTDGWEWQGFDSYYGLIEVNKQTMKRTIKPSAYVYGQVIKNTVKRNKK